MGANDFRNSHDSTSKAFRAAFYTCKLICLIESRGQNCVRAVLVMSKAGMPNRRMSHVIFDMDGTLVDNLDLIVRAFNYAVSKFVGREFSKQEVYSCFGGPTLEQIVEATVPNGHGRVAVERYHVFYGKFFHEYARMYHGIYGLIRALQRVGIGTSVCTGSSRRMTQTTLKKLGLRSVFPVIVTADDVEEQKPDPEGLVLTMQLAKSRSDQTVYLGDAVRDIEASWNAGVASAAVLWGFSAEAKLKALKPDFVFTDPLDAVRKLT